MEVESQNTAVTGSRGRARTKKGLREHMAKEKQHSFEDLFKEGRAFTNSTHSDENLFDDFDDPFEDERDHATTVTPVDKVERTPREANSSPKGVDEQIGFDPFSALVTTGNSFYQKSGFDDVYSGDEGHHDAEKSPLRQKLQNLKSSRNPEDPFATTCSQRNRRSTLSHFAPESSMAQQQKDESGFAMPVGYRDGKTVCSAGNDRRAGWSRRASTSDLNLSGHSSASYQSDTTGMAVPGPKTPRRAGKKPNTNHGESAGSEDDELINQSAHSDRRPAWGRYASMTNLSRPSASSEMPVGFAVPSTPCAVVQKLGSQKMFSSVTTSPNPFCQPSSRKSSIGTTQMLPTPKKSVTRMIRRASVATGLGHETTTMTPKITRRASVATGLGNDPSTPMASMRVRIRQQRKGSATGGTQTKIDEDMVRRLVKEHLAKERQKKEQDNKDQHGDQEIAEDETERSDSDEDSTNSFEDDATATSCSSRSSCSSRWEDDGDRVDEVPRLLARHVSSDGDSLLPGWSPTDAAQTLSQVGPNTEESREGKAEEEEEPKVPKEAHKVKKTKKDKKGKKDKKEKKEKKKRKSKQKSKRSSEEAVDDNINSNHVEVEGTKKVHSSIRHRSSASLERSQQQVGRDEVLSAIRLAVATKKKDKAKKSKKTKKKDEE